MKNDSKIVTFGPSDEIHRRKELAKLARSSPHHSIRARAACAKSDRERGHQEADTGKIRQRERDGEGVSRFSGRSQTWPLQRPILNIHYSAGGRY